MLSCLQLGIRRDANGGHILAESEGLKKSIPTTGQKHARISSQVSSRCATVDAPRKAYIPKETQKVYADEAPNVTTNQPIGPAVKTGRTVREGHMMKAGHLAKTAAGLLARVLHILIPRCCLACQAPVWTDHLGLGLCGGCAAGLRPWPDDGCAVCQRPLSAADTPPTYRCSACRLKPPPYNRCLAAWSYESPLDSVLQAYKFRGLRYLGEPLGRLAALRLGAQLENIDLVVPVPLHWHRRLARGFDQAEILSRAVAKTLRLPCQKALRRRRHTRAQSLLTKTERRQNLTGAFTLCSPAVCPGRHVLLVDDVLTTGATLETAARAIQRAKPLSLTVLSIARTPAADQVCDGHHQIPKRDTRCA